MNTSHFSKVCEKTPPHSCPSLLLHRGKRESFHCGGLLPSTVPLGWEVSGTLGSLLTRCTQDRAIRDREQRVPKRHTGTPLKSEHCGHFYKQTNSGSDLIFF